MTPNLLDAVNAHVSPDVIGGIARDAGASPGEVTTAAKNSTPSIFAGFIRTASTELGATKLLGAATEAHGSGLLGRLTSSGLTDIPDIGTRGESLLGSLYGDRANDVTTVVAQTSGVRPEIATRVLSVLTPIALAVLGKEVVTRRLGPQGLTQLLANHKNDVIARAPRGLEGALALGTTPPLAAGAESVSVTETPALRQPVATTVHGSPAYARRPGIPWGIIAAVAAGLIVLGLLWSNMRKPDIGMKTPTVEEPVVRAPMLPPPAVPRTNIGPATPHETAQNAPAPSEPSTNTAPEGTNPPEAAEPTSRTTTTSADVGRVDWASYEVQFQFGTSQLAGDGNDKVKKLADEMSANPNARIRLAGHTDSVGNPEANKKLALERAVIVRKMLVDQGIDASRIEVTSAGAERAVATNGTAGGRAQNRRVDVSLISKK